ncbi:MAG TPA: hypothetical protein VKS21_08880 [Spirochaetota bacterium]|nr:hypothetical protein [Spirochaetota bacterium]
MKYILFIISTLSLVYAGARNDSVYMSPRAQAMGSALTAEADSADAAYFNPAALVWFKGYELNGGYQTMFSSDDFPSDSRLSTIYSALSARPWSGKAGAFGAYFINDRSPVLKEYKIGISYGYQVLEFMAVGATFDMDFIKTDTPAATAAVLDSVVKNGYSSFTPNANLALSLKFSQSLLCGFNIKNIIPVKINSRTGMYDLTVAAGIAYSLKKIAFLEVVKLNADIIYIAGTVQPKLGFEGAVPGGLVALRLGFQPASMLSAGLGVRIKMGPFERITVNYGLGYHYQLGELSHKFGLSLWL